MRPLSDVIRPSKIEDMVGQKHLICKGSLLYNIIKSNDIPNMIFYGPSGTGKTTLANIIANKTNRKLYKLNATTASTSDIKAIFEDINIFSSPNGILLYLDEIQYFNKRQQQSLLEFIENGKITLIASTTENPYFYIYNAILSRCSIFEFKSIEASDIKKAVNRAFKYVKETKKIDFEIEKGVTDIISNGCGGDVRKAINAVDVLTIGVKNNSKITAEFASQALQKSSMRYDRDGDNHYDILSAFQKSIRGSDENAALHYLARLIEAEDLISISRRLLVIASEDIGLAYPNACVIIKSLIDSAMMLGFPEARIPLAQAVIFLATCPKSNSAILAIDKALSDIKLNSALSIPNHLRDSHYSGAKNLGHAEGYKYSHNYKNHYVKQQFLPDALKDRVYYNYGDNKYENATKQYWEMIKNEKE